MFATETFSLLDPSMPYNQDCEQKKASNWFIDCLYVNDMPGDVI